MSLNTHLRASEDHAVLPFNSACPICRAERLAGRLPATALVSSRLTALAVAGVTAGCALTPAPGAMAQEAPPVLLEDEGPLEEDEPVESDVPEPNVPPVVTDDPAAALDPADPPPPTDPSVLGGAPVPDVPVEDLPVAPAAPPSPVPPVPATPPAVAPPAAQRAPATRPSEPKSKPARRSQRAAARTISSPATSPATATPPAPVPVRAGSAYVVRPGDTLWSIARARLGREASRAEVSALVEAIWLANAAAIQTGDPDLILPGTRLVFPGAPG